MSESCDRPSSAVEIFFKTADLVNFFVNHYIHDAGTLLSVARLTHRTMELMYKHPDLVLAREKYKTDVPGAHTTPLPFLPRAEATLEGGRHPKCCRKTNDGPNASVYCQCSCHAPCLFCIERVFQHDRRHKIRSRIVTPSECEMFQRHLDALYVHGSMRIAVYYRQFAGKILSPTFDVNIPKLLSRGHYAAANWIFDNASLPENEFAVPPLIEIMSKFGEIERKNPVVSHTFQINVLLEALWDYYDTFPDKKFIPTLDAALRYLDLLGLPATLETAKGALALFFEEDGNMNPETLQVLFERFPGLKILDMQTENDDSVPVESLLFFLTRLFLKHESDEEWHGNVKCVLFLLDFYSSEQGDRALEETFANVLHSVFYPDDDIEGERTRHRIASRYREKHAAQTLTRLFQALDGHVFSNGRVFIWHSFFKTMAFHDLNLHVIDSLRTTDLEGERDTKALFLHLTLCTWSPTISAADTIDDAPRLRILQQTSKMLRTEQVLLTYMNFVTARINTGNKGDEEPLQKRSRQ